MTDNINCIKIDELEKQDIVNVATLPYCWEKFDNKTILISGGTGFIGTFITNVFRYRNLKFNTNVRIVSLSRRGGISDKTVEFLKCDINQPISSKGRIDYILHLASNTHPKQYSEDPVGTITTNVIGCNNLLKLATEKKAVFLLASSVEIYGQGSNEPMDEQYFGYLDCNVARNGYNEAKRTCEALCQSYRQQYGLEIKIARLARVFGADRKCDTKAMSQFMDKAVAGEDIILKSKGQQRFSYCYVADAASGILKILLEGKDGEAYNITDEDEGLTLGNYAEYIASLANKKVVYRIENNNGTSKATIALLDAKKLKSIGWKPLYKIQDGLKITYKIKRGWLRADIEQ